MQTETESQGLRYYHEQVHEVLSTTDKVYLERVPTVLNSVKIYLEGSNQPSASQTVTLVNNAYELDLNGFTHGAGAWGVGDKLTIVFQAEIEVDWSTAHENKKVLLSNLPDVTKLRKIYRETGVSPDPSANTSIILEHPPANRETPGATNYAGTNGNIYLEINGAAGTCTGAADANGTVLDPQPKTQALCADPTGYGDGTAGSWTNYDVVSNIDGNVLTMDLTDWIAADGEVQEPVNVYAKYESYEHEETYKFKLKYNYYKPEGYSFNYSYNTQVLPTGLQLLQHFPTDFYDISYYIAGNDDLYLKATLEGSGEESPIIRRLRFER